MPLRSFFTTYYISAQQYYIDNKIFVKKKKFLFYKISLQYS